PPVEALAVRFTIRATTGGSEPCLDELEAWTSPATCTGSTNVALATNGGRPSSSGNYPDTSKHRLVNINDAKYGNDWSWISDSLGAGWVQVDFAAPRVIERVVWGRDRLGGYSDRLATDYAVTILGTDGAWHEVASS